MEPFAMKGSFACFDGFTMLDISKYPNWDVSVRKGHHEGLISLEAFEKIQKRVKEDARAPARKDLSADFPTSRLYYLW